MRTLFSICFCLFVLLGAAQPAVSASIGTQTSQLNSMSVTVDGFAYRLSSTTTYTRSSGGMGVDVSSGNMFSVTQPAGPQNNAGYSVFFTIPQDIIDLYY